MGVYGYGTVSDTIIPEGYVDVKMADKNGIEKLVKILHPSYPGSIYHMTKTQDALFFNFMLKNWEIKNYRSSSRYYLGSSYRRN